MKKAEATRFTILQQAQQLIYRKGYQATSIDDILATTKVTKGAFYYHFKNKEEMGVAIVYEILKPKLIQQVQDSLLGKLDIAEAIYGMVTTLLENNDFMKLELGCPLSNLIREMAPDSDAFTKALKEITLEWQNLIANELKKGIERGNVRSDIDPHGVAIFVISSYWGIRNFIKIQDKKISYNSYLNELKHYLKTLI